jgi:hypothetical protein
MGEIISLKQHRKRRARAARDEKAAENRAKFGRAKDEKNLAEALSDKAEKDLDSHKLED